MKYSFLPKMTVTSVQKLWPQDTENENTAAITVQHEAFFFGWRVQYLCGEEEFPNLWVWTRRGGELVTRLAVLELLDAEMLKIREEMR